MTTCHLTYICYRQLHNTIYLFMTNPLFALLGALIFVNLMMLGGEQSAVSLIGRHMADEIKMPKWVAAI